MKYRRFGNLDWQVSALGFGTMRLPVIGGDQAKIDEPEAIRMIRYAIDHGVNYLDTAYVYHMGHSEALVGKTLSNGYREKIRVATKLPALDIDKPEDFDRIFNEQLRRLDMDKVDFYLLHGISRNVWHKIRDFKVMDWLEKQVDKGRIDHIGFSFHDEFDVFKEIVDYYDNWSLAQVQYNYMDVNEQAGRRGVEYAANKGLAVVIMEPLRGGKLSKEPVPPHIAKVWAQMPRKMKPVEWAFRWLWNQPEVSVTLSGMSTMEQVVENCELAERAGDGGLTKVELKMFDKVREAYRSFDPIPCTGCRYCQPCPNKVEIPRIFQLYNDASIYDDFPSAKNMYNFALSLLPEQKADNCIECGECLEKCPQKINIPEWLKKAHEALRS